jgi:RND family efflux transporter MFP subunit
MKGSGPKFIKLVSAPADESVQSGGKPRRICYVDDSRTSAYVTRKILTEYGYDVDHYPSAEPAIVALLENDYDLLLTDLLLSTGGMDGDDLVRFLRMSGHPKKKLLPVIVITGSSEKDTLLKIYEAGANGVLVKPISGEELNERIRSLLPEPGPGIKPSEYALEIHAQPAEEAGADPHAAQTPETPTRPAPQRAAPPRRGKAAKNAAARKSTQGTPTASEESPAFVDEAQATPSAPEVATNGAAADEEVLLLEPEADAGATPHATAPTPARKPAAPGAARAVRAFGAKKNPPPPEPGRDAASVIAELRAHTHPEDEEDIPTLTLALDVSEEEAAGHAEPLQADEIARASHEVELVDADTIELMAPAEPIKPTAKPNQPTAARAQPAASEPLTTDSKAIITALDITQDFTDIQDDYYQPSITQTVTETVKRYKVLSAAAFVSLGIIGWSLVGFLRGGDAIQIEIVRAEMGELHQTITVPGKVVSKLKVDVGSNSSGQVKQVFVKEGDKVRKGQSLAQLENDEISSEVKRAEGNLVSAQEETALAEKTLARMRRAFELGAVSRQAVEEADAGLKSARAKDAVARENVRATRTLADKLTVTAPFDGTVTVKQAQVGQYVKANEPMFSVMDLGQREIEAKVDAADVSAIRVGQEVDVSSDAFPGRRWAETVSLVAPATNRDNSSNTVNVMITLGRKAPALKVGQQVDAEVRVVSSDNAVKLPIGALIQRNGKSWVATVEDGRAHFVPVTTGMEDLTHVEIAEGVRAGQSVILPRGINLREGDKVMVVSR